MTEERTDTEQTADTAGSDSKRFVSFLDESNQDAALRELLERPFWISTLEANCFYRRTEDDCDGDMSRTLSVGASPDGDFWISLGSGDSYRFRMPHIGGGRSPRTRNALMFLAEAIRLDNQESATES